MMKIIIMPYEEIAKQTIRDVEAGKEQKEELIIYFHSLKDFRSYLVRHRARLLNGTKKPKPELLRAISRLLKKNFKSTVVDAGLLEELGLLSYKEIKCGKTAKVNPLRWRKR